MNRVVIVDDDAVNRQMAGHLLSKAGMRVTAYRSGQAFLDGVVDSGLPDLILLDIKMPDMDGFETLHRFRKYSEENGYADTPVIFLTADEDIENEQLGFREGAADYIHKPFDPQVLVERIRHVLDREETITNLKTEAAQDQLTGFLNKSAVSTQFPGICSGFHGCLMMIDLDSFKLVNDLHGHEMGDKILIIFSKLLRELMPKDSIAGRVGGDEFIVLLPGVTDEKEASDFADAFNVRLISAAKELLGEESDIPFGASMGAAFLPQHGDSYEKLTRLADKALYVSKIRGTHCCTSYRSEMDQGSADGMTESDLQTLSTILGERNVPDMAYQLNKDAFAYVYQFVIRYITRNKHSACKVLFTLYLRDAGGNYGESCDRFDEHLKQSLRKSDIYTRSRFNQFFVFLTDIREESIQKVIDKIIDRWYEQNGHQVDIAYEKEYVTMSDE